MRDMAETTTMLDVVMFSESVAARLLRVPPTTLHRWLNGDRRRGVEYPPVIRVAPTDRRDVTWGEFVEAGLLAQYRYTHKVPLRELRTCVDRLRERFHTAYPLASKRPYVGEGRRLLLEIQEETHLDPDFCLVAVANDQPVLLPAADYFVSRVEFDEHQLVAVGWRPSHDPDSPVRMRPDVRFGLPAIGGIRTEVLWEHAVAGDEAEQIADEFNLEVADVEWALAYERVGRRAEAA
jgi:uncharacterized protein (DUF433 family)